MSNKRYRSTINKRAIDFGRIDTPLATDLVKIWRTEEGDEKVISLLDLAGGVISNIEIGTPENGLSLVGNILSLDLASAGVTGALSSTDWSTFNAKIGGSIASGQVAFGTASNTIDGDSGFLYDSTNNTLSLLDTGLTTQHNIYSSGGRLVISRPNEPLVPAISIGGGAADLYIGANGQGRIYHSGVNFSIQNTGAGYLDLYPNGGTRIFSGGAIALEVNETLYVKADNQSVAIQVQSGRAIRSGGTSDTFYFDLGTSIFRNGNGAVELAKIGINITPTESIDTDGRIRVRTIDNLGSSASRFLVASATGVISERTASQMISDLGISGGSNWTVIGSDIYRNSRVLVGASAFTDSGARLEIVQADADYVNGLTITNTQSWGYGSSINFKAVLASGDPSTGYAGRILQGYEASGKYYLAFFTSNFSTLGERVRITAEGRLGVGTGSPSELLDVNGRARVRTIDNVTGDFLTTSASGVIQKRTASEVAGDIGAVITETSTQSGTSVASLVPASGSFGTVGYQSTVFVRRNGNVVYLKISFYTTEFAIGSASGAISLSIDNSTINNILGNADGNGLSTNVILSQLVYYSANPFVNPPRRIEYSNTPYDFNLYKVSGDIENRSNWVSLQASDLTIHASGARNAMDINIVILMG